MAGASAAVERLRAFIHSRCEASMHKSASPGLLAWLAAIAIHAGVVWLVAPPL